MITIKQINISTERGTAKFPVESAVINENGIEDDAHSGDWHRQITILAEESVIKFEKETGRRTKSGEFATNIMINGLDTSKVKIGDRIILNDAEVEVTQIGKEPHFYDSPVLKDTGRNIMFDEGLFAKVLKTGKIKIGDKMDYIKRPLRLCIITLSDRVSQGIYEDRSGPKIKERLLEHYSKISTDITVEVIPDDKNKLDTLLKRYTDDKVDAIFTTGGTGVGPRDITPDAVTIFADKLIPGIMDHIRMKYGKTIPNALLSRSVAAVKDKTLIYTLPGSVKAVTEYMDEILKTIDHLFKMLNGEGH
ncbi:MAG: molybdenum cofactor synthesis protein [Candidatus Delongbacteria bacterium]|nr:molybdenum cofactor synthesis protein [Candidatus Delongbacteria bacterium]